MFVHRFPGYVANEVGLGTVGEGQRLSQLVERLAAHWALHTKLLSLVALPSGRDTVIVHDANYTCVCGCVCVRSFQS